jgi:hypothetical protein
VHDMVVANVELKTTTFSYYITMEAEVDNFDVMVEENV